MSRPTTGTDGAAPALLRRPGDLAREAGGVGGARAGRRSLQALRWPDEFAATREDRTALLVLLSLPTLTAGRLLELAQDHGTASACLRAAKGGRAVSEHDRRAAFSIPPERVAQRLGAAGGRLEAVRDDGYPGRLLDLWDPPAGLFVRGGPLTGEGTVLGDVAVAIVGARNCSTDGRDAARALAAGLARARACVVSGAARGIDAAAHEGALSAGGASIAVLGSGIDVPYPAANRGLIERLASAGAVVSEYPPGTRAEPFRFPARNRVVAALSTAVVVVEGTRGSGSMITADHALDLGREVFAVPGSVWSELSEAPLKLLREGATLVRDAGDLLADLGLAATTGDEGPFGAAVAGSSPRPPPEGSERAVWDVLRSPAVPDAVAATLGWPLARVMSSLVRLELAGMARSVGGRYERTGVRRA